MSEDRGEALACPPCGSRELDRIHERPRPLDTAALFRRHHARLLAAVARACGGDRTLAEDGCSFAWAQAVAGHLDNHEAPFAWLYVVAIREAWRLRGRTLREPTLERSDQAKESLDWRETVADPCDLDNQLRAREALRALAELRPREREYLSLLVAGYRYREITALTGATYTNVNKHLARARARLRAAQACVVENRDPDGGRQLPHRGLGEPAAGASGAGGAAVRRMPASGDGAGDAELEVEREGVRRPRCRTVSLASVRGTPPRGGRPDRLAA